MGILDSLKKLFNGSTEAETPVEEAPQEDVAPTEEAQSTEGGETQEEQAQ